jgi:hypothetical protein
MDTTAYYQITLRGYLDISWEQQLGMSISHLSSPDGVPLTVLTGQLIDQAALFGVLNGMYGLGFPLISVGCTPCTEDQNHQAN